MEKTALHLHAPWPEVKEKLKENDVSLTDDDLAYEDGKEDELLNRLQRKLHKSKEQIKDYIESISANEGKAS
jgi:uncharacterized protein YjbJ (UPF0337 family)